MEIETRYVRCKVSVGFFASEFYVTLANSSAFIDRSNVKVRQAPKKGSEVDGEVLAYVIDESDKQALIEIPGEAVVGGLRSWIPKSQFALA